MPTAIRRFLLSLPLLLVVAVTATTLLLHLHQQAWIAHGESPGLWDWKYALLDVNLLFAVAQYIAAAAALTLAWISWDCRWRPLRYILLSWGITWLPVVAVATGDVTASTSGPFNFPMSMFAAPLFAFFCLAELGVILLFHAMHTRRSKVNPVAQQLAKRDSAQQP
ncbi:MAG: hypothetical protein IJ943_08585 [Akkermansia sp.]|nr:hypothetical protein [Akkermansia sp.]